MACQFEYNGEWYSEEELKAIFNNPQKDSSIINASLKATNALFSDRADDFFKTVEKNKLSGETFWKKMQSDLSIPKEQIELLKAFGTQKRDELITNLLANYSYTIEINTAKGYKHPESITENFARDGIFNYSRDISYQTGEYIYKKTDVTKSYLQPDGSRYNGEIITKEEFDKILKKYNETPNSSYYSNLTVPGGTNYTENEIATPGVEIQEKPQGVSAKEGVQELFESNPELASIGTQEQYSQYLDTIFPDSKVKDIVYHGTVHIFDKFVNRASFYTKIEDIKKNTLHFGRAIFSFVNDLEFTSVKEQEIRYNKVKELGYNVPPFNIFKRLIPILYELEGKRYYEEIKERLNKHFSKEEVDEYFSPRIVYAIINIKNPLYTDKPVNDNLIVTDSDSIIGYEERYGSKSTSKEISVFEPEQIHILGNKQDIEGFKNFVKNNTKTVRKGAITPSIKGHAQFATDNGIGWFRSDDKHAFTGFLEDLIASGTIKKVPCG